MSCRTPLVVGIVLGALAGTVQAQAPDFPIAPGERIRVLTAEDGRRLKWEGILRYATPDSVVIDPAGEQEDLAIAWPRVVEVRRFAGRKSNVGTGALIGGTVLGVLGLAGDISCASSDAWGCPPPGAGTLSFGLLGAGVGALIGLAAKSDRWDRVDAPSVEVIPTVQEGRPGVAVRVPF